MDGASLDYKLEQLLRESSSSAFIDQRSSYDYLYEAAKKINSRTAYLKGQQTITTVTSTSAYDLEADFMNLYFTNSFNEYVIKYQTAAGTIYWITWKDYDKLIQNIVTSTDTTPIPSNFTIVPKKTITARITGTATATGTLAYEETALTDAAAPFSDVSIGDSVHNTTDASAGTVIAVTSTSVLVTSLFGGTDNTWTSGDAYIVIPQGKKQIVIDTASANSGDSIIIDYVQLPTPVYSAYRTYRIDQSYEMALVYYAAWLYKSKDRDMTDYFFKCYDREVRQASAQVDKAFGRGNSFKVNFNKRSQTDRSYR
jgi:hypothetical protein